MKRVFLALLCLWLSLATSVAQADDLILSGIVQDGKGEPLAGASISVRGTNLGTSTDLDGKFKLLLVNTDKAMLYVTYVGFTPKTIEVKASQSDLKITLEEDALKLNEVVVTGLATSVKRTNLANAIATISAAELLSAPTQTMESALSGKFAGVNVSQNTGAPGGGINVDLRGVSSIEGGTQPLYVVDGVIVNNAATQSGMDFVTKAAGAGSRTPQGQPTNRIADINPNDIENIEVLKGASAAAIYGAKASNGVILITTKRGKAIGEGGTSVEVSHQFGFNKLLNKIGTRDFTLEEALDSYDDETVLENFEPGQKFDYEDLLYGETGWINETSISARGGTMKSRFYASGTIHDEDGIIKNTGYKKYAGKLNVDHIFNERININLNTSIVRTESDRGITGNDNTNTSFGFSLAFTPSFVDIRPYKDADGNTVYPDHPLNPSNPLHTRDALTNTETVNRSMGAMRLNINLLKNAAHNLDFIVQSGVDHYAQENRVLSPSELQFEKSSDQPGTSIAGETGSTNANFYLNLAHKYTAKSNMTLQTSAGWQYEYQKLDNVTVVARGVTVTQSNVDQSGSVSVLQDIIQQKDRGFYIQEEVSLQDRIMFTASLRGDASSSNGDSKKYYMYPKASTSVRLSKFDFWEGMSSKFDEFKLRLAYGETGNLPPADAKYISLNPSNIGGQSGVLFASRRGDPDIQPERTKELEFGFDAAFLKSRGSLEFTVYQQKISDLILTPDLPPSSGFTEEYINGGEMETKGLEVGLKLTPIKRGKMNWTTGINYYRTRSEITQLDIDPFNIGGFATFLGTFRIEEGWSPTAIIGSDVDSDGNIVEIGNETPDFQMSFHNNFSYGNVSLNFLWDWKKGGDVINLGKLIYDLGQTTEDFDTGAAGARLDALGTSTRQYVEDGSYLKLRELTLSCQLPAKRVMQLFGNRVKSASVSLSGRNLIMITDYTGYDPEVSQFGNVAVGRSVDTIPFPSSRSYYFKLNFGL